MTLYHFAALSVALVAAAVGFLSGVVKASRKWLPRLQVALEDAQDGQQQRDAIDATYRDLKAQVTKLQVDRREAFRRFIVKRRARLTVEALRNPSNRTQLEIRDDELAAIESAIKNGEL